ncbi:MAG TPA: hypothetical protein DC057_08865 [Spirochaetia bacterium]|nr:MAG: hypothetical protein A2Y30_01510 [Spirochaetes bacterium GWE1_32_154]OHD47027.1 MAG: hypothetical protein A2Y29_06405 [Spirochaetes bacterium GWE2_31_10]HBD94267.1 hypothetical protein [Spirochaetia bacterium]
MNNIDLLKNLYLKSSKHSNYQLIPECLNNKLMFENLNIKSRFERERMEYIISNLDINKKKILDIGGNSGYFTFELINRGAKIVDLYEGNKEHSDFVSLAAEVLSFNSSITVFNKYVDFKSNFKQISYDITLLLNVLHHIGDDYGNKEISLTNAKKSIVDSLNFMADKTKYLVFQLGFNWKGNTNLPLFINGTKKEVINFVSESISEKWEIKNIGIAEKETDRFFYRQLNDNNIIRNNELGEFLNRPIFILKSKIQN